jgi:RNA recognition motif-containing protein
MSESFNPVDETADFVPTKLYVTNFPQHCTRRHLTDFFNKFGQVIECAIMWDSYAFIHYRTKHEAVHALEQANRRFFMGSRLAIQLSKSKNRQDPSWYQKEASRLQYEVRSSSSSSVSDSSEPIDSSDSSFLANTVETKLYVTNLPDECDKNELKSMFDKYGNVLECVVMWNHYAFVHYSSPKEANIALKHVNGQRFCGKTLIVQLSTSSNRPLPKCIALSKNKCAFVSETKAEERPTRTDAIKACYRVSDLESDLVSDTVAPSKPNENLMEFIRSRFELSSLKSNLLNLLSKTSISDSSADSDLNDRFPMPPLPAFAPYPDKLLNSSKNPFDFQFSQIDTLIPSHTTSSQSNTTSLSQAPQISANSKSSEKKVRRSRCRIVNYFLYPELNENLSIK